MKPPHKKLSMARYRDQTKEISRIFDLMRHSIKELGTKGFRRFMESARVPEIAAYQRSMDIIGEIPEIAPDDFIVAKLKRDHRKKMAAQLPLTPTLRWVEDKGDALLGLNRSELIIRVALFEAFLKEIHRHPIGIDQN
jgi:hypothetical protein